MTQRARAHAITAAVALAAFLWLTTAVIGGRTADFDEQLRFQIHQFAAGPLTTAMKIVTAFGAAAWVLICTGFCFLLLRKDGQPRAAMSLVILVAGGYALENALKFAIHRPRPEGFFMVSPTTYSFPSGHALLSTTLYGTLGYIASRRAPSGLLRAVIWFSAGLSIALICFSRVYLGVHYPTDVVGGVLIACFWMNAVLAFAKLP
jgi:undecaprenyl-diphosphatase